MGRKILFITTDQQRYDTLGCNGGTIARTPVVDALAADGIRSERAHNQNVVCMPARSTMLTGQYVAHARRVANGVPLPADAPSVAAHLHGAGYRTALLGKAHFEPALRSARPAGSRTAWRRAGRRPVRTAASSTSSWRCTCRLGRLHYRVASSSASTRRPRSGFSPLLVGRARRRRHRRAARWHTTRSRASGTTPTGWPTARSRGSTRSPPTTTGSAG